MNKQIVSTEAAPSSPLYSQAVRVGSTIHVSGMVFAVDPPARAVTKLGVDLPNVLVSIMMTAYLED
jgi:hypothetical protein